MEKSLLIFEKPKQAITVCEKAFKSVSKGTHLIISPNEFFPNGAVAVWCIGHILRSKMPGDYKSEWKEWKLEQLPMIPDKFELEPEPSKKGQVSIIRKFVHDKEIIDIYHFGDAGREGQLLVDEVLLFVNNKKPVKRVWSSSLTKASIHKALKEAKDNKHYKPLYDAAYTRQVTDWVIGMNASRALSMLMTDKYNFKEQFQLGRCKTPLVGIVYNRELTIEKFQSKPYWDVEITFNSNGNQFIGKWFKGKEEHIGKKEQAAALKGYCIGKAANIETVTTKRVAELPPQFYNLTELQSEANKRFGFSPSKTLEIAQELYEIGVISYPRADPRVVSTEEAQIFPLILEIISDFPKFQHLIPAPRKDLLSDKRYVNNELVDDHYAIIPTEEVVSSEKLSAEQSHIYDMIVESFIVAHYDSALYDHTEMVAIVDGHFTFKSKGKVLLKEGWRKVIPVVNSSNSEDGQTIPLLKENEKLKCESINVLESKTTPPKRFTQGQLVKIMERAASYVPKEEREGYIHAEMALGTVATRANIIKEVIANKYVSIRKNHVYLEPKGRILIEALEKGNWLSSPVTTGKMENSLNDISNKKLAPEKFMLATQNLINNFIKDLKTSSNNWNFKHLVSDSSSNEVSSIGLCPLCGGPVVNKGQFYGCAEYNSTSCSFTLPKRKGAKEIPVDEIRSLLKKGTTGLIPGFKGKNGKMFNAHLTWNKQSKRIEFEFPK